ncbi:hypothetical protein AGMMS49982_14030 [Bacteroidia bacterium]|nr:hypothetical protein AGMMS49982_14030 [Bacteroidia bacterium]
MKTKVASETKPFDTVETFRKIKETIAKEVSGMTFEQLRAYLQANSQKLQQV